MRLNSVVQGWNSRRFSSIDRPPSPREGLGHHRWMAVGPEDVCAPHAQKRTIE